MAKKLVLCFDGTGNDFKASGNTNVVRVFEGVRKGRDVVTFCDIGVGTFSDPAASGQIRKRWTLVLGLAFGYGIKDNLENAYNFLVDHWEENDEIYLFGFSRGAYTARALAGLLHMCGLLEPSKRNLVDYAIGIHWRRRPPWALARRFKREFSRPVDIEFLGVWDTVKTEGVWDALLQGIGTLFERLAKNTPLGRLERLLRSFRVALPYTASLPNVKAGRHAISMVHSDIGGGYKDDHMLGDITMAWVVDGAREAKLRINDSARHQLTRDAAAGPMHNSLLPIWWVLGWRRRHIPPQARIHQSVDSRRRRVPGAVGALIDVTSRRSATPSRSMASSRKAFSALRPSPSRSRACSSSGFGSGSSPTIACQAASPAALVSSSAESRALNSSTASCPAARNWSTRASTLRPSPNSPRTNRLSSSLLMISSPATTSDPPHRGRHGVSRPAPRHRSMSESRHSPCRGPA